MRKFESVKNLEGGDAVQVTEKTKLKDGDVMSEENVEIFIEGAIRNYFDRRRLQDGLFWREAIRLLERKWLLSQTKILKILDEMDYKEESLSSYNLSKIEQIKGVMKNG